MTVKEIAEAYDISTSTVRQRINAGKSESEIIAPTKKKYLVEKPVRMHGFLLQVYVFVLKMADLLMIGSMESPSFKISYSLIFNRKTGHELKLLIQFS